MRIIAFTILLIMASCSSDTITKPDDLIDKAILQDMIVDISKSNATVELAQNESTEWMNAKKMQNYEAIFEHYKVSEQQFKDSYAYHLYDLDSAAALYDRVLEQLSIEEIELNKTDNNE